MRRRQKHDGRYGSGATAMDGTGLGAVYTCEAHHILGDVEGFPKSVGESKPDDQYEQVSRTSAPFGKTPYVRRRS